MDPEFSHALYTVVINKCVKYMKLSINYEGISRVLYNVGYVACTVAHSEIINFHAILRR